MVELFSKAEDCHALSKKLMGKLGNKICFCNSTYNEVPWGIYLSPYRRNNGEYMFNGRCLPFCFKFSEKEFLRITVSSNEHGSSLGERMAALSDFYAALSEEYGEPTFFYTIKDDDEKSLTLQWSFVNKEDEIENFKNGTYFVDAETNTLIVFGEKKENTFGSDLNDKTKRIISKQLELPFELISLVDSDIENFIMHKNGKVMTMSNGEMTNECPVTPFERSLRRN